jgi:ribonucleoside-diphosphate reductase alpha chain
MIKHLSRNNIYPVRNRFELNESTKRELLSLKPSFGFNGLGEVVFRRTYSRDNEDWGDVVIRVIEGTFSIRKDHFIKNSFCWNDESWQPFAKEMALSMFHMKWLPPGRGLWMMGTEFAYERGSMALNNCGAIDTTHDIVAAAEWTMDALMHGVGVGFSTTWRGNASAPNKKDNENYVIEDSREGWVDSLITLMCAYIESPKYGHTKFPVFDYSLIRPAGVPIKGFGGQASGPDPLKKLHSRIENYLDNFCKGTITVNNVEKEYNHTRLVADIFNAIGACVVAGNVRRSAEISLGDVRDTTFTDLKNYVINPERMEIGWMSNNSVVLNSTDGFEDFSYIPNLASRIRDNGEPGVINLYNIQKYGRYGKEMSDKAFLVNPCAEISLESAELCNLAEIFPPRCNGESDFYDAISFATFYATTVSLLPTHRPETNEIIARNRRIGVSISGIAQWVNFKAYKGWCDMNYTALTGFLRKGYKLVRLENARLSADAGVPASVRVTAVKPSGSISLLAGVTPGVHYPVSRFAIRRMRIGETSPLVPHMIRAGIPYEKDKYSDNSLVFEFVIDHGDVRPCDEVSPWEQFSLVALMQRCWSDNLVSATIYFDNEKDGSDVEKLLAMYIPVLKSISMLPHSNHGYAQAPYEHIDETEYKRRLKKTNIDFKTLRGNVPEGSKYCSGDRCER